MGITISIGVQKGGVGKTTVTSITSWLLSRDKKVLAVDFDSQGNLTQFLSRQNPYDFTKRTVLEACKEKDPRPYIHQVSENLFLLPAEDFLSGFSRYLYDEYKPRLAAERRVEENPYALYTLLKETLDVVKDEFDYILIDLPPNLGEQTLNGIVASDFCVVMLQSEPFSKDALDRYLETIEATQKQVSKDIYLAGILTSMIDARTTLARHIIDQTRQEFESLVFDTEIRRKARITEFSFEGISDRTKEDREALQPYEEFVKELIKRVQG